MCLLPAWFEQREARRAERDRFGVSLRDAESALSMYYSTVDPVATEMADWILENWPKSKIASLGNPAREILALIVQEREERRIRPPEQEEFELDVED
jgi:hypothetical protein